jgi:hypothetical protein
MDVRTGRLYNSMLAAIVAGVQPEHLVEVKGSPAAVRAVSQAVRDRARRRRKIAAASRRKNRARR